MSSATCMACRSAFPDAEGHREHYRSEWHRFNLKRRAAQLPPVDEATYNKRVAQPAELRATAGRKTEDVCTPCQRGFPTHQALLAHQETKSHRDRVAAVAGAGKQAAASAAAIGVADDLGDDDDDAGDDAGDGDVVSTKTTGAPRVDTPRTAARRQGLIDSFDELDDEDKQHLQTAHLISETECLFCGQRFRSVPSNVRHMARKHSFFIPDIEYLQDLPGLLRHLGDKISLAYTCLTCNGHGRGFNSLQAVRHHMQGVGHCKMAYEKHEQDEYSDYYDFSASYDDAAVQAETDAVVNEADLGSGDDDDDDAWEDVADDDDADHDGVDADDDLETRVAAENSAVKRLRDRYVARISDDGLDELIVGPPGQQRRLGNRNLVTYYRQRVRPASNNAAVIAALMREYRRVGHLATSGRHQKERMQSAPSKSLSFQAKSRMRLGVKGNALFKPRAQVFF